jgi:hypothetical protein
MLAMTTFELWEALERGHVVASMRVWREGMECWTPIGEVGEFAWSGSGSPEHPLDDATLFTADGASGAPPIQEGPTPPPESTLRPVCSETNPAPWIALGSAVAVVAVVSAINVQARSAPAFELAGVASGVAQPTLPVAVAPSGHETALGSEPAPEHCERGQRRLPRGGRRAYGR